MAIVYKMTRPGADVSSTDMRDFIIHSGYKNWKAQQLGSSTIVIPAGFSGAVAKDINHGLGYTPMYVAFIEPNANKWYNVTNNVVIEWDAMAGEYTAFYSFTDGTKLRIAARSNAALSNGSPITVNIKYFFIIDEKV